jgi:hypothetical protein
MRNPGISRNGFDQSIVLHGLRRLLGVHVRGEPGGVESDAVGHLGERFGGELIG